MGETEDGFGFAYTKACYLGSGFDGNFFSFALEINTP
jgi:hypothetical protein